MTIARFFIPILIIIGLAAGGLFIFKSSLGPAPAIDSAQRREAVQLGAKVPDFNFKSIQGKATRLSDIHSKVILINFWATWCEACMVEMPSLVKLRQSLHDKGFEVIGVNLDENPESILPKVERESGIKFPIFSDTDGKVAEYFDVHAIPLSVLLGENHQILAIENGERDWNSPEFRKRIEKLLSEK